MKTKTVELTGAALDWAVAVCENVEIDEKCHPIWFEQGGLNAPRVKYTPSTNWSQGGPIIERERIVLREFCPIREDWEAEIRIHHINAFGGAPLIAAMRCYVASKLGDEVEVPNELLS